MTPADTPSPRPLSEERVLDLDAIKARRDALMKLTFALAEEGPKAFRMSIPVQQSDADLVMMAVCADIDALLTELASEREARERYKALGARALEQWSERDGIVEIDGFTLTHTDDADLGVWTADDAANDRTATAMFWEDDPYRAAFEWFADRTPSEDAPHV